jgi:O-antigen/teichoic acid export membrane protein
MFVVVADRAPTPSGTDVGPLTTPDQDVVPPEVAGPPSRHAKGLAAWTAPVHRDGLALVLSSGLSSAVGLGYWVLVARLFTPTEAGINSAALATLNMLGGIAHLNMQNALLRFVPVAGPRSTRLVTLGYTAAVISAALIGTGFALGAPWWAPEMVGVAGLGALVVFFAVGTPLMAMFDVQDNLLTGLRKAMIVPVENLVFSLLKVGLLVVAAVVAIPGGISLSWIVATAAAVVAVNVWVFGSVLPKHAATTKQTEDVTVSAIARFAGMDYAGSIFWQAAIYGLPLLILARLDAPEAATYQIVWTMTMAIYLVATGMTQSMVAHAATDPASANEARRATTKRVLILTVPAVAVLTLGAHPILAIFGEHYSSTGTGALVFAALSALPNVVTASALAAARVQRRMRVLLGVPASIAVIVIGMSWVVAPFWGLTGIGLSWLVGQSVVAAALLVHGRLRHGDALAATPARTAPVDAETVRIERP